MQGLEKTVMIYGVLLLFFAVDPSFSFLLDDRSTTPVISTVNAVHNFNDLVALVTSERDARLELEQRLNATVADQSRIIASLVSEHNVLKAKYDVVEYTNRQLGINLTKTEIELENMKNRLGQFEQMKIVSELQLVLDLQNHTRQLQDELDSTNVKLDRVSNENNVRKDDIIALYNTVNNNENTFMSYAKSTSDAINRTSHDIVEKIDRELHNMSGRALLTTCASAKNYSSGSNILFPYVETRYGVSESVISELGTAGNYRVESSGVYLISAFITTDSNGYYKVYVNNDIVAYGYFFVGTNYITTAVTLSKRIEKNDKINIIVGGNLYIFGGPRSCLTILQLNKD